MTCLTQYAFHTSVATGLWGRERSYIFFEICFNNVLKMFATDPKAVGLADLSGWSPVPWDQHIRLASRRGLSITRACLKTGRGRPAGRGVWCSFGSECQILGRPGQWMWIGRSAPHSGILLDNKASKGFCGSSITDPKSRHHWSFFQRNVKKTR